MARYQDISNDFNKIKTEISEHYDLLNIYQDKFNDYISAIIKENYKNDMRIGEIEEIQDSLQFYSSEIVKKLPIARTLAALQ